MSKRDQALHKGSFFSPSSLLIFWDMRLLTCFQDLSARYCAKSFTCLWSLQQYCLHFTEEKTEAQSSPQTTPLVSVGTRIHGSWEKHFVTATLVPDRQLLPAGLNCG